MDKALRNAIKKIAEIYDTWEADNRLIRDIALCFEDSQFEAKSWLVDVMSEYISGDETILVVGGWYGLQSKLLLDKFPNLMIDTIDKDEHVAGMGKYIFENENINYITGDIEHLQNIEKYDIIISTAIEHIVPTKVNSIVERKRKDTIICFQSNDEFNYVGPLADEHFNCSKDLEEFKNSIAVDEVLQAIQIPQGDFYRFMVIGK